MYETRKITFKCGHTKDVSFSTEKTGKQGRSYIDYMFSGLEYEDCPDCKREKGLAEGVKMTMKMYFKDGKFYAGITSRNSYDYKDVLKSAGMKFDREYNWNFAFENRDYKELLNKKIEDLKAQNIIITEVDENNVFRTELHYRKLITVGKLEKEMLGKDHESKVKYAKLIRKINRAIDIAQLEAYLAVFAEESDPEADELTTLKASAIAEMKEQMIAEAPSFTKEGKWNGTIYGKAGNYSVYINGDKREVSDEEYAEYKSYEKGIEDFNKMKETISAMTVEQLKNKEYMPDLEGEELRKESTTEARTEIVLDKPSCIDGYNWNGRYYGNGRKIYRDNKSYILSDAEYQSIQDYQASLKKYKEVAAAIKGMSKAELKAKAYRKLFAEKKVTVEEIIENDGTIKEKLITAGGQVKSSESRIYIDSIIVKKIIKYESLSNAVQNKIYDELKQNYIFYNYKKGIFCKTTVGALLEQAFQEGWDVTDDGIIADLQDEED